MSTAIAPTAEQTPQQEFVWIQDAAPRYGISIRTLYRLRDAGVLTFHRRRGCPRVLVDAAELAEALKTKPIEPRAKAAVQTA
jgi:hypothetical protein